MRFRFSLFRVIKRTTKVTHLRPKNRCIAPARDNPSRVTSDEHCRRSGGFVHETEVVARERRGRRNEGWRCSYGTGGASVYPRVRGRERERVGSSSMVHGVDDERARSQRNVNHSFPANRVNPPDSLTVASATHLPLMSTPLSQ